MELRIEVSGEPTGAYAFSRLQHLIVGGYPICGHITMAEARVVQLERKLDAVMKALNLLLFEEGETLPEQEVKELKARLEDYLKGGRSEFLAMNEHRPDV